MVGKVIMDNRETQSSKNRRSRPSQNPRRNAGRRRRARKKVAAEGMIPVAELISEIEKAAHAIAAAAGEHGLGGEPGVARLRAALERLKM